MSFSLAAACLLVAARGLCQTGAAPAQASAPAPARVAGVAAPAPAAAPAAPFTAVNVALRVDNVSREVRLIGRTAEGEVLFSDAGTAKKLPVDRVQSAYFELQYDPFEVFRAVRRRDWTAAINTLMAAVRLALPYLDLPNNNAAKPALDAGSYMIKAADEKMRSAQTPEDKALAEERYKAAYSVLKYAAAATWFSGGQLAELKRIQCLLALQKPKTARQQLSEMDEPMVGDAAYGLYWLVKAQLELQKPDYQAAIDAAVKSLCFENKDANTFPDALLLSARCYEELQNWHRARDVYYEVARVFPSTEWSAAARTRLQYIMDKKFTDQKEQQLIENVFFGLNEDMNKLSRDLLARGEGVVFGDEDESKAAKPVEEAKPTKLDEEVDLDKTETENATNAQDTTEGTTE